MFLKSILKIDEDHIHALEISEVYSELITRLEEEETQVLTVYSKTTPSQTAKVEEAMFSENIYKFYESCFNYF